MLPASLALQGGPMTEEQVAAFEALPFAQDAVGQPHAGYEYGRTANPTRTRLEERLAVLENGQTAIAFPSGMAAEDAVLGVLCQPGDHVIIPSDVYGGTYRLVDKVFQRWGLSYSAAPLADEDETASLADLLGEEDGQVEHALDMAAVSAHWKELPEREQRILLLRFYGNKTQAEIGEMLGISQMHVSRLLARTLTQLRDGLTTED